MYQKQIDRFRDRLERMEKAIRASNTAKPEDPGMKEKAKNLARVLERVAQKTHVCPETWADLLEAAGADPALLRAALGKEKGPEPLTVIRFRTGKKETALCLGDDKVAIPTMGEDDVMIWEKTDARDRAWQDASIGDVETVIAALDTLPAGWIDSEFLG